ncbi:MAG: hypothetical protein AABZ53_01580 [Planctomycetota bacterium]
MKVLSWLLECIGALWELARLGVLTRFKLGSAYWRWRLHTAFGRGYPSGRVAMLKSVFEYGRWVFCMRRMR